MAIPIKKAVITAGGWGTRFLPVTKAIPKEMLPIVDKPVIQYVVEEVVASGIQNIIIITGEKKRAIEDHFDSSFELENHLEKQGKKKEKEEIKKIAQLANFIYIRQKGGYGNAIPVLSAKAIIEKEPFVVLWGDEFILSHPPRLVQMLEAYEQLGEGIIISAIRIKKKEALSRYGIAEIERLKGNIFRIKRIVEKPSPSESPSNLAAHGAYILTPEIFEVIQNLKPGKGGEIWLTDAINTLIQKGFPVYACEIKNGKYYDAGNKLEYLKTVIEISLQHPEFAPELRKFIKELKF